MDWNETRFNLIDSVRIEVPLIVCIIFVWYRVSLKESWLQWQLNWRCCGCWTSKVRIQWFGPRWSCPLFYSPSSRSFLKTLTHLSLTHLFQFFEAHNGTGNYQGIASFPHQYSAIWILPNSLNHDAADPTRLPIFNFSFFGTWQLTALSYLSFYLNLAWLARLSFDTPSFRQL